MNAFDPDYKLLDEMYQDDYYPTFLVDKVKDELQKVIDLLESGETDIEVVQETLDEAVCGISSRSLTRTEARSRRWHGIASALPWPISWSGSTSPSTPRRPSGKGNGKDNAHREDVWRTGQD